MQRKNGARFGVVFVLVEEDQHPKDLGLTHFNNKKGLVLYVSDFLMILLLSVKALPT